VDSSIIVKNANGSYTRTTKYGKVFNFNSSGKLTSIVDQNGNTTLLPIQEIILTNITDSTGRTIVVGVNGGKINLITDYLGHIYSISYDATTGLITSIADCINNTWSYHYNSKNGWT